MKKLLVTGFEPFMGATINTSNESVKLLQDKVDGIDIIKATLPTVYGKGFEALRALIEEHDPDIIVCTGQAAGRNKIGIERVALNLRDAVRPDNEGNQPIEEKILADGEIAYYATLPAKTLYAALQDAGIPSELSYSAGTFVCNEVFYRLTHLVYSEYPDKKAGFIHVPGMFTGSEGMPIEKIAAGLNCCIRTLASMYPPEE